MDNDLMARRLRPQSQPNTSQPAQPTAPWDVPLTDEGEFAPADPGMLQPDPPFAPPDPAARADVPWDRPAPEAWPPTDDNAADPAYSEPPRTWSAEGVAENAPRPNWPAADQVNEAPWDRPPASEDAPWQDPDDALAPVVGDVPGPVAWASWNGNGNANSNGHASSTGDGYASTQAPEQMWVAAQSDRPSGDGAFATSNPYPEWPAEDDLSVAPSPNRGAVTPEDSWSAMPPLPIPAPEPPAPEPSAPESAASVPPAPEPPAQESIAESEPEPEAQLEPQGQPEPHPEPELPPATPQSAAPPAPFTPSLELTTPPNTQIVAITPTGTPENMVLRIELAIVDASQSADPADTAKRVGPDADVRRTEFEPRNVGGGAPIPEPEYIWGAPPPDHQEQAPRQQRNDAWPPRQSPLAQPPAAPMEPQQTQQYAPPPSSWLPAPPQARQTQHAQPKPPQPQEPQQPPQLQYLDWDLPQVVGQQAPTGGPSAPWSTPQHRRPHQQSYAPPPTWAMTQPTPVSQPDPPQYIPPPASPQQSAVPHWPPQRQEPRYPSAAPWQQPESLPNWPPQHQDPLAVMPAAPQHPQRAPQIAPPVAPAQSAQSALAVGSRAPTGAVAADQADLWFLDEQPATATMADNEAVTAGKSNSILTAGLTIGFALLVIVLVLVFIQLMTSLLR